MKVYNIISYFKEELIVVANEREVISWAYLIIKHVLGLSRSDTIVYANKVIGLEDFNLIRQMVHELKQNRPIQYILQETEFLGRKFKVNKHTLIPRPETEELVEWILKEDFSSALDVGTGSGCIAVSLAVNTNALITAIDVSDSTLDVAKKNAILNKVKINFLKQDIFKDYVLPKVDIIVSNPPYVLESEKKIMSNNILNYEPDIALFVSDNNPLIFYERIGFLALKFLNSGGKLFFEINERFSNDIIEVLTLFGFVDIELKKDINDKDRMIKAIKK